MDSTEKKIERIVHGAWDCEVGYLPRRDSDADPTVLFVQYRSLLPEEEYIKSTIKIEFSCRNLREPWEQKASHPKTCFPYGGRIMP